MRYLIFVLVLTTLSFASDLVQNGDFELNTLDGWTVNGTGTATVSSDDPYSGAYAAVVDGDAVLEQTLTGLLPNTLYEVTMFVKCGTSRRAQLGVTDFDESRIIKKSIKTEYTEYSFDFTTGPQNTSAKIFWGNDRNDGTILADDISVKQALAPPAAGVIANPPEGYKWVPVDELTDEFNDDHIDDAKWHDTHPVWVGRAPSAFKKGNAYLEDGFLLLRSTSRVESLDEVNDPMTDIWVDAAAVVSKKKIAEPGWFYEARFKAADISMMSSFWFRIGQYSEIDVIEHIGHASDPSKSYQEYEFAVNTHVYGPHAGPSPVGGKWKMPTRGRDEYHNYGLWWKDPETLYFYHNGVKVMTITPAVPFEEKLHLIFDTEVFTWLGLPTIESLNDSTRNVMSVDWVRTWKLVEDETRVGFDLAKTPQDFLDLENYPNPFNGSTVLEYELPNDTHTQLDIYNTLGQSIKSLVNTQQSAGQHSVAWDSTDESGAIAPSGLYFAILKTDDQTKSQKLLLVQ